MAKYKFVHLPKGERISVGVTVEGRGDFDAIFQDGSFSTDDEAIAEALKKHPSFESESTMARFTLDSEEPAAVPIPKVVVAAKAEIVIPEEPIPPVNEAEEETKDAPAPATEERPEEEVPDYWKMTKRKLMEMCRTIGVHVHADNNKDEIIRALEAAKK